MGHGEKESKKNMPNKNNKYRLYRYNWIHISIRHPIFRRTLFVRLVENLWPILYLFGFYVWPKATLIDAEAKRSFECVLNMYLFTCQLILSSVRYGTVRDSILIGQHTMNTVFTIEIFIHCLYSTSNLKF